MIVTESDFGTNNCSYLKGYNCTPDNANVDTSFFPQAEQVGGVVGVYVFAFGIACLCVRFFCRARQFVVWRWSGAVCRLSLE